VTFPVADRWFDRRTVDDAVTMLWEPHVTPLMQCTRSHATTWPAAADLFPHAS